MSTSQELIIQELIKLQKQQNELLAATLTVNATMYTCLVKDDKGNISKDVVDVFINALKISVENGF